MKFLNNSIQDIYIDIQCINDWHLLDPILMEINKITYNQTGILDFCNLSFLDPRGVVMLLGLTRKVYDVTGKNVKIVNINSDTLSYLEKLDFFKISLFVVDIDLYSIVWSGPVYEFSTESVIKITRVSTIEEKDRLVDEVRIILEIWYPEERYRGLRIHTLLALMETCGNSLEHSTLNNQFGECYFMLQKTVERNNLKIYLVTADFGVGIRDHIVRKYGLLFNNDCSYIKEALEGRSGRMDNTGGMGLQSIQSITKKHNGTFIVRSDKGTVSISGEVSVFEGIFSVEGTQSGIILRRQID